MRLRPIFEEIAPTGMYETTAPTVAIIMQLAEPDRSPHSRVKYFE